MFDAANAWDTVVVDDPDEPQMPVVARTRTDGALTMQVLMTVTLAGRPVTAWHRRTPDLSHTACGGVIHSQFAPLRRETLREPLCPECFTNFELSRSLPDEDR